jgi:uncharacterized protein (DUF2267 family)
VRARTGLDRRDAGDLAHATLLTLAERIPDTETRELAAQLPRDLVGPLEEGLGHRDTVGYDEFARRIAQRTGRSATAARQGAEAVMASLMALLPRTELDYVRAALSQDYRPLFGDVAAAREREPALVSGP